MLFEDLLLPRIDVPQANVDELLWIKDGLDPGVLGDIGPLESEEEGNGTAVQVARRLTATGSQARVS
jgi:hypothetical protein